MVMIPGFLILGIGFLIGAVIAMFKRRWRQSIYRGCISCYSSDLAFMCCSLGTLLCSKCSTTRPLGLLDNHPLQWTGPGYRTVLRYPAMRYWTALKFWVYYAGFMAPSLLLCGAPGAMFIKSDTGVLKFFGIALSSLLLASLLAWRLARDATLWDATRGRSAKHRAG